jgi:hypothetical protein
MRELVQARHELILDIPEDELLPKPPVSVVASVLPVVESAGAVGVDA